MISWEIKISIFAPKSYFSDVYLDRINDTIEPCIIYLDKRLSEISFKETNIENSIDIFKDIFDEMPVLKYHVDNDIFRISYNNWVDVIIDTRQIYRNSKIDKILV